MAVPLLAKGELKGVLFLRHPRADQRLLARRTSKILSGIASRRRSRSRTRTWRRRSRPRPSPAPSCRASSPRRSPTWWSRARWSCCGRAGWPRSACLFADIRGFTSMAESESPQETVVDAQRLLHGDGRRGLPARGQPRQVHRRLRDGGLGSAVAAPRRPGARAPGGARDAGRGGGAQRGPRGGRQKPHRGRHRRQHRPGGRRLHGLARPARVHRHRRLREHRLAAVRRGEGRTRSSPPRPPSARRGRASTSRRCRWPT